MISPKSPPVHVLMKPRTHRLNAYRTLEYYTPEDVQKLVDQLGERIVAVPVVNQADLTPSGKAICTCPSGDGSLRWPCPQHPPAALAVPAVDKARFESAPCYLCGYNGPGYYQPSQHPCAAGYHAQQPAAAVPEGYVPVPRKATTEMLKAALPFHYFCRIGQELADRYERMVAHIETELAANKENSNG